MRKFLLFIFLSVTLPSFAQEVVLLPDPGEGTVLLNQGWEYRMGDPENPALLPESLWKPINPHIDVNDSLPTDIRPGIGWLRVRLQPDRFARDQKLALLIHQSVASEIYLNGRLIGTYGRLSEHPAEIKVHDPRWRPLVLDFTQDSIQQLTIRFALPGRKFYTTIFETTNSLFAAEVMRFENAMDLYHTIYIKEAIFVFLNVGISLVLFVVHFSFFFAYRSQRANLFLSLFALFYFLGYSFQFVYYLYTHQPEFKFFLGNLVFMLFMLGHLMLFYSIQRFLEWKPDKVSKLLLLCFIIAIIINAGIYRGWRFGGAIFQILVLLNIVRISFISMIEKRRGARIMAFGAVATLILFITFALMGTFNERAIFLREITHTRAILYMINTLCLPAAASIFLAMDFARIDKNLTEKLAEVKDLSARNLAAEKEKQEILTSQNIRLEQQVLERTEALRKSLNDLKSAQAQLIQAEKMASLGQLTAGIAHEIQNPLNFVNNFSEVNNELIAEMLNELEKGNIQEARTIATDIHTNLQKINHHGKRADAIVKDMLQHSRASSGQKEPTDINALCDEYLRLAYHGFRAKDNNFHVQLNTDFDKSISKIDIVPQEIGRVLLNLYNNAFYALSAKTRTQANHASGKSDDQDSTYQPALTVNTKNGDRHIQISITDNGSGIPEEIRDKIFQPFFTTRPAGQGTGLGLSLSYDIVTKGYGGELFVETKQGKGSTFIVKLPKP